MLIALTIACDARPDANDSAGGGDSTPIGDSEDDNAGLVIRPERVVMEDSDGGIEVTIEGGTAGAWRFGAVWPANGWTDEACGGSGYPLARGHLPPAPVARDTGAWPTRSPPPPAAGRTSSPNSPARG